MVAKAHDATMVVEACVRRKAEESEGTECKQAQNCA